MPTSLAGGSTAGSSAVQRSSPDPAIINDPSLPQRCRIQRGKRASSQTKESGNPGRQSGGTIEIVATVRKDIGLDTAFGVTLVLDAHDGNCFYSEDLKLKNHRIVDVFGFEKANPAMNPSAVAHFLRLQSETYSSVTLKMR